MVYCRWIETLLVLVLLENVNINGNGNVFNPLEPASEPDHLPHYQRRYVLCPPAHHALNLLNETSGEIVKIFLLITHPETIKSYLIVGL